MTGCLAPTQSISKNGYLYVYVSNESEQNVYVDNVTVCRGILRGLYII